MDTCTAVLGRGGEEGVLSRGAGGLRGQRSVRLNDPERNSLPGARSSGGGGPWSADRLLVFSADAPVILQTDEIFFAAEGILSSASLPFALYRPVSGFRGARGGKGAPGIGADPGINRKRLSGYGGGGDGDDA